MKENILLVDDDPGIARVVTLTLEGAGYEVAHAKSADAAYAFLKTKIPDLLLLDVELPGISGFDVLKLLKQDPQTAGIPVIMLTVRAEVSYKVHGFEGGADDYLVKPFAPKELVARTRALMRRVRLPGLEENVLEFGDVRVDINRREVCVRNKRVDVAPTQLNLLILLMERRGHVLTYRQISEYLSGGPEMTSGNIQTHVKALRSALGPAADCIENVHGTGYKFVES